MGRIAWGRVVLGGIVAGAAFNAFEFVLHGRLLEAAWRSAMLGLGKTPESIAAYRATSMPLLVLWAFLVCLFGVWLYAAIRPRLGPGPRTAVVAGLATWFAVTLLTALESAGFGLYPRALVMEWVAGELIGIVVSVLIGAWFYREA
jgi:hypothetical protein